MTELMIISGLVLIICITSTKVLYKFGVPMLFIFIVLGMLFGSDGLVGIYFDNFELTKQLCSLASFLEVESGSNDPIAYMSTLIILSMMENGGALSLSIVVPLVIKQILFGLVIGLLLAKVTVFILRHANFEIEGFYAILVTAVAILSYSLSEFLGGNGYLSVYITGIIIGNSKIPKKKSMFHFFDGISWIMQIGLFFILGLLSFPSKIPYVTGTAISISLFMIFIARPLATFLILSPFKFTVKEKLLISWVGLRGAASVVFAIFAVTYGVNIENDIFHIIFFIALFSVVIQGTLIPTLANKLDLVNNEEEGSVLKTFTDYTEEINSELLEFTITEESNLKNKMIMDANIPEEILIVMIKRGNQVLVPKGSVLIKEGDKLVLSGNNIERL